MDIPRIGRDRIFQSLKGPSDADQPGSGSLQPADNAVVMTLPASQSGTVGVDRDQRHEDQVRLDRRRRRLGLHDPEGAWNRRIASEESKRFCRVVERREGDNRTDRPSFLNGE